MARSKVKEDGIEEKKYPKEVYDRIINYYVNLFSERFRTRPTINHPAVRKLIKERLDDHSEEGITEIIRLFWDDPENATKVFYLPTILSAYYFTKYSVQLWRNPAMYADAEEYNSKVY